MTPVQKSCLVLVHVKHIDREAKVTLNLNNLPVINLHEADLFYWTVGIKHTI